MALLIKTDGSATEVKPKKGKHFSLEEMQTFVGGYIELVRLDKKNMWLNEEGKLRNLPMNDRATLMAHANAAIADNDYVVGDVLIATEEETE